MFLLSISVLIAPAFDRAGISLSRTPLAPWDTAIDPRCDREANGSFASPVPPGGI